MDTQKSQEISSEEKTDQKKRQEKFWGGVFLGAVACISASAGFSYALGSARKGNSKSFESELHAESLSLATRALARGTVYAFVGVGLLTFCASKVLGVHSLQEFREKMEKSFKSKVPDIPRNQKPGRSDFASFRELFEYLGDEDKKNKERIEIHKSNK